MQKNQISNLIALSIISSPLALQASKENLPIQNESSVSSRAANRKMKHLLSVAPQIQPKGQYVGELQERWQFPSDHLPIGMTIGGFNILSWNVLDAKYMSWVIDSDSQGLKRSLIVDEHVYIEGTDLTIRDMHVADLIAQTINHPTHPKSLLALQECSWAFLKHLQTKLPPNFKVIRGPNAMIVDTSKFDIQDVNHIYGIFSQDKRPIDEIILRNVETSEMIRLINVHLPGDPMGPARSEFSEYLASTYDPNVLTIAMGDMNFNELEMGEAMRGVNVSFSMFSPYCTNVSPRSFDPPFHSKAIDHFIIMGDHSGRCLSNPEDVMEGLRDTASLLMPSLGEQKAFQRQVG